MYFILIGLVHVTAGCSGKTLDQSFVSVNLRLKDLLSSVTKGKEKKKIPGRWTAAKRGGGNFKGFTDFALDMAHARATT